MTVLDRDDQWFVFVATLCLLTRLGLNLHDEEA